MESPFNDVFRDFMALVDSKTDLVTLEYAVAICPKYLEPDFKLTVRPLDASSALSKELVSPSISLVVWSLPGEVTFTTNSLICFYDILSSSVVTKKPPELSLRGQR